MTQWQVPDSNMITREIPLVCITMGFGMGHAACHTQAEGVLPLGPFQRRSLCWATRWHSLGTPWYPLTTPRNCRWLHIYVATTPPHPCRSSIRCHHVSNHLVLVGELAHVSQHALRMSEVRRVLCWEAEVSQHLLVDPLHYFQSLLEKYNNDIT